MKAWIASLLVAQLLAGCSSVPRSTSQEQRYIGGPRGDTRLIINDSCVETSRSGGAMMALGSIGTDLLLELGALSFKSFGTFLEEAGKSNLTQSIGGDGGLFYSQPDETGQVNVSEKMRCFHIVRNGYAGPSREFTSGTTKNLTDIWKDLGLNHQPDLYALLVLEAAGEDEAVIGADIVRDGMQLGEDAGAAFGGQGEAEPEVEMPVGRRMRPEVKGAPDFQGFRLREPAVTPPYFRLALRELYVGEFQEPRAAGSERDLALVLNFSLAKSQAAIAVANRDLGATELTSAFSAGGIRFPGVKRQHYAYQQLTGLQTGWMQMPPTFEYDTRTTVDISVNVIEASEGNQMLTQVGQYLSSAKVVSDFRAALSNDVLSDTSRDQRTEARFDQIKQETRLARVIEDAIGELERAEASGFDDFELIKLRRSLEDQLAEFDRQRQLKGWISTQYLPLADKARSLIRGN